MSLPNSFKLLFGVLLLMGMLSATRAEAQSFCPNPPNLGDPGTDLCVHIEETNPPGASMDTSGSSPLVISGPTVVGAYTIDSLIINLIITADGMAVTIEGAVTRTSPGSGGLSVYADGGLSPTPFEDVDGDLILDGEATGISQTKLGGSAGKLLSGTSDLEFVGFGQPIEVSTLGAETFTDAIYNQNIYIKPVAVRNHTYFHLNDVGTSIIIPSIAGIGGWKDDGKEDPPPPPPQPPWIMILLILVILLVLGGLIWIIVRKKDKGHSEDRIDS
jgi:hypothetical protein